MVLFLQIHTGVEAIPLPERKPVVNTHSVPPRPHTCPGQYD